MEVSGLGLILPPGTFLSVTLRSICRGHFLLLTSRAWVMQKGQVGSLNLVRAEILEETDNQSPPGGTRQGE